MLTCAVVSVTLGAYAVRQVAELTKKAGLPAIEWGANHHVPMAKPEMIDEARIVCADMGLQVASYGSYYKLWPVEDMSIFKRVRDAAVRLGAPNIRIWAGDRGSLSADGYFWAKAIEESVRIADIAKEAGLTISYEYHPHTLTDSTDAALALLSGAKKDNLKTYWQVDANQTQEERVSGISRLAPYISNIHVHHCVLGENKEGPWVRRPLAEGQAVWQKYIAEIKKIPGDRFMLLEFVKDHDIYQFYKDAKALLDLCK